MYYSKEVLMSMSKDELLDLAHMLDIELSSYDKGRKERIADKIIELSFGDKRVSSQPATAEEVEVKRDIEEQVAEEIPIVSLWPARVRVRDNPSGKVYFWPEAGTVIMVEIGDVEYVMSQNHSETRGCCGPKRKRIYFEYA